VCAPFIASILVLSLAGCVGSMARGHDRAATAGTAAPAPAVTSLRRLTRREYDNTVRDLLGDTRGLGAGFAADALGPSGFTTGGTITGVEAVQYLDAAEALAEAAVRRLDVLLPCRPARDGDERCAARFLAQFGRRAWRGPVGADELARITAVYRDARARGASFGRGVELALTAMLAAPRFLYHREDLPGPRPSPHDVAARLSYFLWQTMPDAQLLALADSGALAEPAVVEEQARRMLADPRAQAAVVQFQSDWLGLDEGGAIEKDRGRFPDWTPELRASVEAETPRFVTRVLLEGDGRLETLLTARSTWVDDRLARLYGLPRPPAGTVAEVEFPAAAGRSGVLTQAQLLARNASPIATSPTRRGKVVRERLLCQPLPPPPPNADMTPPRPKPGASIRDQVSDHALTLACAECHDRMDPIGFAFEGFDAIGRAQQTDAGKPIDSSGELEGTDIDGKVSGADELGRRLADSDQARRCLVAQMFRFAFGRRERDGEPALRAAYEAFRASDGNVRELMLALTTTEAFMGRGARGEGR
jgi:hypothetical protein